MDGVAAILAASERIATPGELSHLGVHSPATLDPATSVKLFVKSDHEAELILEVFRNDMAPHIPFVVIPADVDSNELRQKKPFLFLTVLMVACRHDKSRQTAITKKIREVLGYRILIKGEQSLDMLQGLLVCLSWLVRSPAQGHSNLFWLSDWGRLQRE